MAKKNAWWTNGDSLYGGETIEVEKDQRKLGIKKGDVFRIEKRGKTVQLIPKPTNKGGWKKAHDKDHPIKLEARTTKKNKRVFSMRVNVDANGPPKTFFLAERKSGDIVFSAANPEGGRANSGSASIRR